MFSASTLEVYIYVFRMPWPEACFYILNTTSGLDIARRCARRGLFHVASRLGCRGRIALTAWVDCPSTWNLGRSTYSSYPRPRISFELKMIDDAARSGVNPGNRHLARCPPHQQILWIAKRRPGLQNLAAMPLLLRPQQLGRGRQFHLPSSWNKPP
jgi:hypothetical protein